jgi:hypothetical protein
MRTGLLCAGLCLALLSTFAISCSSSDMLMTTGGTGGSPGGGTGGSSGVCATLTNYVPTTSTAPSFATDIYPILSNTNAGSASSPAPGCGQTVLCHGNPPAALNLTATATLSFVDSSATVKAALLASWVDAPSMKRVDPGHVGTSFLAYKLSGSTGVACVSSSCPPHTTAGNTQPCGDPMPNANGAGVAALSDTDRSKILDWIALGAHD